MPTLIIISEKEPPPVSQADTNRRKHVLLLQITGGPGIIALFVFSKYLIYLTSHCKSLVYKNVALEILYRMINYVGLKLFQIYLEKYEK